MSAPPPFVTAPHRRGAPPPLVGAPHPVLPALLPVVSARHTAVATPLARGGRCFWARGGIFAARGGWRSWTCWCWRATGLLVVLALVGLCLWARVAGPFPPASSPPQVLSLPLAAADPWRIAASGAVSMAADDHDIAALVVGVALAAVLVLAGGGGMVTAAMAAVLSVAVTDVDRAGAGGVDRCGADGDGGGFY